MVLRPSSSKSCTTSRGVKYYYHHSPPTNTLHPTLLLLHGFPSHSSDWAPIVKHFASKGYGTLVPELLGYGNTSKPADPAAYRMKLMCRDIVELLDHAGIKNAHEVVAIGHDWGSGLCSRLANYFPDRFRAFAFLALGYFPPVPGFNIDAVNRESEERNGYAKFGYWRFFEKEEAAGMIEAHLESWFSLMYNDVDGLGQRWICPEDGQKQWLAEDKRAGKLLPCISQEMLHKRIELYRRDGLTGPLCWYKAMVRGLTPADDADIPPERAVISKPVFYAACKRNFACPPEENSAIVRALCPNATVREIDSGHWVILEAPNALNVELETWLAGI